MHDRDPRNRWTVGRQPRGARGVLHLIDWMASGLERLVDSRLNPLKTLVSVETPHPVAALTFDDGPDPRATPAILDALDRHGARATFFMIGHAAERHPELVGEVARRGHCVANHTHTHPSLPDLPGRRRRAEIRRCRDAIAPHGRRLFRAPKGHQTPATCVDVLRSGYEAVGWSVSGEDWVPREPEWIAGRVLDLLAPGSIVLLHDGLWDPESSEAADRGPTVEAVETVLERSEDRYRFVTLPELVEQGSPVRTAWYRRAPRRQGGDM